MTVAHPPDLPFTLEVVCHARVGERCFVGSGSFVRQEIVIGSDCFIAMDSVLYDDLASGSPLLGRH